VLAREIVVNAKITDYELGGERYYAIQGLNKRVYQVSLNTKKPSCSCGARSVCEHMIATCYTLGIQNEFGIILQGFHTTVFNDY
jgi:SWIM zinc finger